MNKFSLIRGKLIIVTKLLYLKQMEKIPKKIYF